MLIQLVRFQLPDHASADTFDRLAAETVPLVRSGEPGTLDYRTYTVADQPLTRIFYEEYRDRAALAEHEQQPHTAAFLTAIRSLVSQVQVEVLTEVSAAR